MRWSLLGSAISVIFPYFKRTHGINDYLRSISMDICRAEYYWAKMITRVQAVATSLALIPIVGIALFGWFWFKGETYMAAWNVSGLGTFGAIQSTLNVTLWSFIGVETASVAAGVVKIQNVMSRLPPWAGC